MSMRQPYIRDIKTTYIQYFVDIVGSLLVWKDSISCFNSLKVIDISGHSGITKSSLQPDNQGRPNVWRVDITWSPTQSDKGTHIICASAEDTNGWAKAKILGV